MAMPDNDEIEREGAAQAILREYGNVIGQQQARNIAYHALVGARGAKLRDPKGHAYHSRIHNGACSDCGQPKSDHA